MSSQSPPTTKSFDLADLDGAPDDARPGIGMAIFAVAACVGYLLLAALLPEMLGLR